MITQGEWGLFNDGLAVCSYLDKDREQATYVSITKMAYDPWMETDKDYPMDLKTALANATLIAAAPELLMACKRAKKDIYEVINQRPVQLDKTWYELEAAIEAAEKA